jgi:hypothetical protein
MFHLQFVLVEPEKGVLVLRLPLGHRIVFGGVAGVLVISMAATASFPVVGIVLVLVCAAAALFEDRWVFDRNAEKVAHSIGLLMAARRREWDRSDIAGLRIAGFKERSEQTERFMQRQVAASSLVVLSLELESGEERTVEIRKNRHNAGLKENASRIAELLGMPLRLDS